MNILELWKQTVLLKGASNSFSVKGPNTLIFNQFIDSQKVAGNLLGIETVNMGQIRLQLISGPRVLYHLLSSRFILLIEGRSTIY